MIQRSFAIALSLLALSACNSNAGKIWLRTDGRSINASAELSRQYEIDAAICKGEMERAGLAYGHSGAAGLVPAIAEGYQVGQSMSEVAKGCMAQRGYLHVEAERAKQLAEDFAAQKR